MVCIADRTDLILDKVALHSHLLINGTARASHLKLKLNKLKGGSGS